MNKIQQYIIQASLAALTCALFGGLWLIWQTIEESRALERQNRELQASLEASRIRVENFCEYPTDVLCRVDERSGTVAGALAGELPGFAELAGVPATEAVTKSGTPAPEASPAKALENVQKVAQSQAKIATPVRKETSPVSPSGDSPSAEQPAAPVPAAPSKMNEKSDAQPVAKAKATAKEAKPEAKVALPETKVVTANEPKPVPQKEEPKPSAAAAPEHEGKNAEASSPIPEAKAEDPAKADKQDEEVSQPAAPAYQQEFSGKLSETLLSKDTLEKDNSSPAKPKDATPAAKSDTKKKAVRKAASVDKQNAGPRSTWSRIDLDGEIFAFTLTGSGPSLKARGKLLSSPWRYELTLDGLWSIRSHEVVSNRLVREVQCSVRNGNTVVIFSLKKKPYKASLHRPDARTVSVRIR